MYGEIKKTLPKAKFITYSDCELEIDEQHKWGMEPFHYTGRAFLKQLSSLYKISSEAKMTFNDYDFENNFIYEQYRPSDIEEIKKLARSFLFSQELRLEYKVSSLVVYIYKCIETRDISGIKEADKLGREWFEKLEKRLSVTNKGIREDPVQVALSYYTAMWHASIFLEKSPVEFLEKIRCLASDFNLTKASYSQNVGRALLLLSYIKFNDDEKDESKNVILTFYEYFITLFGSLKLSSPVGSSHFGDINKCANALQCALGGLEWIENKRYRKSLWNEGKVFKLTSRVNDPEFKEKFLKQFSSTSDRSGIIGRLICIGIRYSLFQPGASHYHTSNTEREKYKSNLFSDIRLKARYQIFKGVTLPSLRNLSYSSSDCLMVVIAISKEMPDDHKQKLLDLVRNDDFIYVVEQDEESADVNKAMKLSITERMDGNKCLVSTVRLDDDDALSVEWLMSLSKLLKLQNIGKAYTFPKGLTAFFDSDKNKFIGIVENYSKNIGLGLAHVTYFDGKNLQHESVYSQGDHLNVSAEVVENEAHSYLRVINSFRDKNYKTGSQKDRLKRDFLSYLSRSSRASVSLEKHFNISILLEELDVFFAVAKRTHDRIEVIVHEGTLSERFGRYTMACYFYSNGNLVEKISYSAGPKLSVSGSKYLGVDQVKVYIKNEIGDRQSVKIPVRYESTRA